MTGWTILARRALIIAGAAATLAACASYPSGAPLSRPGPPPAPRSDSPPGVSPVPNTPAPQPQPASPL